MDRFSIALGKKSYLPEFIKIPGEVPEVKNRVVVEDVWHAPTKSISFERSPKKAFCPVCEKFIDPKMFRFTIQTFKERSYKGNRFSVTRSYHVKCLPKEEHRYILNTKSDKTRKANYGSI